MKTTPSKLLLIASLFTSVISAKADDCITNLNVSCLNGWTFTVGNTEGAEGTCWNAAVNYTNLTCRELLSSGGGVFSPCTWPGEPRGTFLYFSCGTNCPSSRNDVATVTYTCNTAVMCAMTQGGPAYCGAGGDFTISISAGVQSFIAFIHPGQSVCCSADWCELSGSRTTCIPPLPPVDP